MSPTELLSYIPKLLAKDRQPVIEGWCSTEKAYDLVSSIFTLRPKVVFEVGVFGGGSLLPMAIALKALGQGQVVGVDPWSAAESCKGMTGANLEWWKNLDHEEIFQGFQRAVLAEGVSNQVVVLRKVSDEVTPPEVIDIAHLDGNHGEQAFRDIRRFTPNIRIGGLCFLDDIGWDGGAVGRGAEWMLGNGFIELYKRDTGCMMQRVHAMSEVPAAPKPVNKGGRPRKK